MGWWHPLVACTSIRRWAMSEETENRSNPADTSSNQSTLSLFHRIYRISQVPATSTLPHTTNLPPSLIT